MSKTYKSAVEQWVNQTLFGDWGKHKVVDPKDIRADKSNKGMKRPKAFKFGIGYYNKKENDKKVSDAEPA